MQLTQTQISTIARWAESKSWVFEIRLFGSRARGDAREDSDIDLAVTLLSAKPGSALGTYFALGDDWQRELAALLGTHVSLEWYPPDSPETLAVLAREAIVIWTRPVEKPVV